MASDKTVGEMSDRELYGADNKPPWEFARLCRHLDAVGLRAPLGDISMDHHATLFQVLTGVRLKHVSEARRACCVYLRAQSLSYPAIAQFMNMDHSSVMYALKRERKPT
jgi:hypothetical protein